MSSSSASVRPANRDRPSRMNRHLSPMLFPGTRLVVAIAPGLTIGFVLPSRLHSMPATELNGKPVLLTPTWAQEAVGAQEKSQRRPAKSQVLMDLGSARSFARRLTFCFTTRRKPQRVWSEIDWVLKRRVTQGYGKGRHNVCNLMLVGVEHQSASPCSRIIRRTSK